MEGNFRIVQESENRFVIEKEVDSYEYKPTHFLGITIWKTKIPTKRWGVVGRAGEWLDWYKRHEYYRYKSIDEAKKALEDIKKYPKVVYDIYDELMGITRKNNNPPPPPLPQKPKRVKQGENKSNS